MRKTFTLNQSFEAKGDHSSVECKAEPLEHDFDEDRLAEGPATAIRNAIGRGIRAIARQASKATIAKRRKRGSGSTALFNDTGVLARGLEVQHVEDGAYAIAAPANRLQNDGEHDGFREQLAELVPAIADPLSDAEVDAAIDAAADSIVTVGTR